MLFPLLVVSNWHDHLRSSPAASTPQQILLDQRLSVWWADATKDWGFERQPTTERGFYSDKKQIPSPLPPTSGLGLYSISPSRPVESAVSVSSASIANLQTVDRINGHRYSQPSLASHPPIRQRANTLTTYSATNSPGSRHRALPSIGSVAGLSEPSTGPRNEIRLPPLPAMEPSPSGLGSAFKFPSFWSKEKEEERGRIEARDKRPRSPSPKCRTWTREDRTSPSKYEKVNGKVSPLPPVWTKRVERDSERDHLMDGPVGIDALISAAEEKMNEERAERERKERLSV